MVITQILVPHDFSPHSQHALDLALSLARPLGAKVHVVHAYRQPIEILSPYEVATPPLLLSDLRSAALLRLEQELAKVDQAGVSLSSEAQEGIPSEMIVATARRIGADIIVMGTHGLTGLKHVLLGSVAERVIRTAPCPVITTKAAD